MKRPKPPVDLWEQMDAIAGAPQKDDPGVTAREFAARHRITSTNATKRLHALVEQGLLIEGKRKHPKGKFIKVYRPA